MIDLNKIPANVRDKLENEYYKKQAKLEANMQYHKKMSKYYGSVAGTMKFLPGEMKNNAVAAKESVKKVASKLLNLGTMAKNKNKK